MDKTKEKKSKDKAAKAEKEPKVRLAMRPAFPGGGSKQLGRPGCLLGPGKAPSLPMLITGQAWLCTLAAPTCCLRAESTERCQAYSLCPTRPRQRSAAAPAQEQAAAAAPWRTGSARALCASGVRPRHHLAARARP